MCRTESWFGWGKNGRRKRTDPPQPWRGLQVQSYDTERIGSASDGRWHTQGIHDAKVARKAFDVFGPHAPLNADDEIVVIDGLIVVQHVERVLFCALQSMDDTASASYYDEKEDTENNVSADSKVSMHLERLRKQCRTRDC